MGFRQNEGLDEDGWLDTPWTARTTRAPKVPNSRRLVSLLQAQLWMGRISFIVCFCVIHVCSLWGLVVLGAVKVDRCSSAFAVVAASASDWSDRRSNHLFCITRLLHTETETKMPVVAVMIQDLHLQKILWKKMGSGRLVLCGVCLKSGDTHYYCWLLTIFSLKKELQIWGYQRPFWVKYQEDILFGYSRQWVCSQRVLTSEQELLPTEHLCQLFCQFECS